MGFEKSDHFLRDIALVEAVARRRDPGGTAFGLMGALGLDHAGEGVGKSGEFDGIAGAIRRAVWLDPIALVVGPLRDEFGIPSDRRHGARAQRKSLAGIFDRARRDLFEAHRAPFFEHRQRRVQRAWNDGGIESGAGKGFAAGIVGIDRGALRRPALPDHGRNLMLAARIDQHQPFPAEAVKVLLDHAADQQRRDPGIERIAAAEQDFKRRRRGQRMAGRDAAIAAHHGRPLGR